MPHDAHQLACTGLDRFGRVIDQRWLNSSDVSVDRYQYTYDRNANRTSKVNVLNGSFTEVCAYDGLNRLVDVQRGSAAYQSWVLDALGNMNSVTTNREDQT